MTRSYLVVYERVAEDNWGGWAIDVGGAVGAGESLEQARASLREGLGFMLEDLAERGIEPPPAITMILNFAEFEAEPVYSQFFVEWLTVELPDSHSFESRAARAA